MTPLLSRIVLLFLLVVALTGCGGGHGTMSSAPMGYVAYFLDGRSGQPREDYTYGIALSGQTEVGYVLADHAVIWNGLSGSAADIHPSAFQYSRVTGISGSTLVGYGRLPTDGEYHALLWTSLGAASSDLNPPGFSDSWAYGAGGNQQVGIGQRFQDGHQHALLWTGSAASAVDLNPAGAAFSNAYGTDGSFQVGTVDGHAALWSGSAASFVQLDRPGFGTTAMAVSGGQQVGYGSRSGEKIHALLWSGTAQSIVDLHPTGFQFSKAVAVAGSRQVGTGYNIVGTNGEISAHALVWSGTAESVVDLHKLLPAEYQVGLFPSSVAHGIDANGNIIGTVTDASLHDHAVVWVPQHDAHAP